MRKEYFVGKQSIVREIWGKGDTILFIFAGAAAEFALSKAVDWLYFTGRLPSDPLGRLFSTVNYARLIVFSERKAAIRAIDTITSIHKAVEDKRASNIPDWAYRDVLFMLIDYSIRSFELLERELSMPEKREVFDVFYRFGMQMGIKGLPGTFEAWEKMRKEHLHENLKYSHYTEDLFEQYRKHLGWVRYKLLKEAQKLVAPEKVRELLGFRSISVLPPVLTIYRWSRSLKADRLLKDLILPSDYKKEILKLDRMNC